MNTISHLEHKIEDEKIIYSIDKFADFGLLKNFQLQTSQLENLSNDLKAKYSLTDIVIHNYTNDAFDILNEKDIPDLIEIIENDLKFYVNLKSKDISINIDEKALKEIIQEYSSGKEILNLFANAGDYSIYSQKGNAKSIINVENRIENKKLFQKNLKLNKIKLNDNFQLWEEDIFDVIELCKETYTKFDILLFIFTQEYKKKDGTVFDLQSEHKELIRELQQKLLKDGGMLFFLTNQKNFTLNEYIRPGADKLTKKTIPQEYKDLKPHQSFVFYN